jgi:hypothetical protein
MANDTQVVQYNTILRSDDPQERIDRIKHDMKMLTGMVLIDKIFNRRVKVYITEELTVGPYPNTQKYTVIAYYIEVE